MSFSKVKTLAAVLALTTAASAQFNSPSNARMAGMAYAPMSDITDVYNYPSRMMEYRNQVQATFNEGAVIGIKSLGEAFAVGVLANQGLMTEAAYRGGQETFGVVATGGDVPYSRFPHILLGLELGALSIGADIFFEHALASRRLETPAGNAETSSIIMNPGARLSAGLELGDLSALLKYGISLPTYQSKVQGLGGNTVTLSPDGAMYMEMGAEVGMPLIGFDWTLGGEYTFANYKILDTDPTTWHSLITFYLGAEFNFLETVAAAAGYSFTREAATLVTEVSTSSATNTLKATVGRHIHSLTAGMENVWDEAYFFDSVTLRGGLGYDIAVDFTKSSSETPKGSDITTMAGNHRPIRAVMGVGVTKSFLTLDIALNLGSWGAAFTGPPATEVTGTIKF